ncbi:betA [Mytilus coruscus]|uniref:BetA n=1 Tax=Mytilus coruscus TaxID=42192 RepID=A0A6J8AY49_MYTCO|nr:betA [Mytilus coruscus]
MKQQRSYWPGGKVTNRTHGGTQCNIYIQVTQRTSGKHKDKLPTTQALAEGINCNVSTRDGVIVSDRKIDTILELQTSYLSRSPIRKTQELAKSKACTCHMGNRDVQTAVVDSKLRVKGIANLRVADASVMRHVASGNTNSPSIMIGEKAADLIRGKDTVMTFRKQITHLKP